RLPLPAISQRRYHFRMGHRSTFVLQRVAALLLVPILTVACGRSDADTAAAVREQLQKDSVTAPLELSVTVADGVATLSGTVYSAAEQARAVEIARAVVGVSDVVDDTTIDRDALLATSVKGALTADPALADVPIEVDARNGYVLLSRHAT